MRIVVLGTGYVGLVQGACLASLGHDVTCVDIDEEKIAKLERGEIPFYEPGLRELVQEGQKKNRLAFSVSLADVLEGTLDIIFLAVGTPADEKGRANLSFIESAARSIGSALHQGTLVVTKSTVPPGTQKKIKAWIGREDVPVASNPEFLREGQAVEDFFHPDRIVVGTECSEDEKILRDLYEPLHAQIFFVSPESAEMSKYAANSMLALRLSFMNEMANLCDLFGADVQDIEKILGSDPRIGSKFLRAGAGFGGSCFPKDVLALSSAARDGGYAERLIAPIIAVNNDQPIRFVQKICDRLGGVEGKRLAIWGLAFNKNTDDVRQSPAIKIVRELVHRGAVITAYDPAALENAKHELGDSVTFVSSAPEALAGGEALLVLTEWDIFADAHWEEVKASLHVPIIFDGKNFLPRKELESMGFEVLGMGLCPRHQEP
ncbi:MAG: UDP-glucose/GDP-mannose dehydrogenase family protein [Patescibacteria group bacterium]|jgi:UDPglucose 6-dehydrogenase